MKLINIKNHSGNDYRATVELENNGTDKSIDIVMNKILKKIQEDNSYCQEHEYFTVYVRDSKGNELCTMNLSSYYSKRGGKARSFS